MRLVASLALLALPALAAAQAFLGWRDVTPPKPDGWLTGPGITDVRAHPMIPEKLLAIGSRSAFVSNDGGETWTGPTFCCVDRLWVHPARPGVVFAQLAYYYEPIRGPLTGGELYRSDDFGATWVRVQGPGTRGQPVAAPFGSDPRDPAVLFATGRSPETQTIAFGTIPSVDKSVLESRDGGRTWTDVGPPTQDPGLEAHAEGPRPAAADRLFFTTYRGVYVSRDGARSWQPFAAPAAIKWIRAPNLDANVLYAYRENDPPTQSNPGEILRSDDGGLSWRPIFAVGARVNFFVFPQLAIDPTNADRLWLTGLAEGVFLSEDGGRSWESLGLRAEFVTCANCTPPSSPRLSTVARNLAFSAARPQVFYVVRDGRLLEGLVAQPTRPAIEYYLPSQDRYWVTANGGEAEAIDYGAAGPEPMRTGGAFQVWNAPIAGVLAGACRFQGNPAAGIHSRFITLEGGECDAVKRSTAWVLEGQDEFFLARPDSAGACAEDLLEVRRFYNQRADANHRYVVDAATAREMRAKGWREEGVAMCAPR